jgi:F plasmid transfer operon protein TraF
MTILTHLRMKVPWPGLAAAALVVLAWPASAGAQEFETIGSRAAGMGGAFVAVADDASAAYWNPAGFAAGSYFSLVLDRASAKVNPAGDAAGSRSGLLIALGAPAIGLSYYRLRSTVLLPGPLPTGAGTDGRNDPHAGEVRLDTLITHHIGATLVQSIAPGVAVGATVKLVRGTATSAVQPDGDRDALLEDGGDLIGKGSTKFDADLGVMATAGRIKAGITLRNATAPGFASAGGGPALKLERQARAGLAFAPPGGWLVAADLDLTKTAGPLGQVRNLTVGTEARIAKRHYLRGGVRLNTVGEHATAVSAGGSYGVTASLLVDVQVTAGSDRTQRGWGISVRFGL